MKSITVWDIAIARGISEDNGALETPTTSRTHPLIGLHALSRAHAHNPYDSNVIEKAREFTTHDIRVIEKPR